MYLLFIKTSAFGSLKNSTSPSSGLRFTSSSDKSFSFSKGKITDSYPILVISILCEILFRSIETGLSPTNSPSIKICDALGVVFISNYAIFSSFFFSSTRNSFKVSLESRLNFFSNFKNSSLKIFKLYSPGTRNIFSFTKTCFSLM